MSGDVTLVTDTGSHPTNRGTPGGKALAFLFSVAAFVGAALLFIVQPLVARLVLPLFGGSATVWSTSNLFFQVALLVGYLYVHGATQRLGPRVQPLLHFGLLLLPVVALPIAVPELHQSDGSPIFDLLWALLIAVGLPFVVISTTGPLLQRWYSWAGAYRSDDPYFLFAASNTGSFIGLLAYPLVIEPWMSLNAQRTAWSAGYVAFALLMGVCGVAAWRGRYGDPARGADSSEGRGQAGSRPSGQRIAVWFVLAFIPSSLMLGVTAHISTDVAAIPLLWVVPLAIYLATFVLAFARTSRHVNQWWPRVAGAAALVALVAWVQSAAVPIWLLISVDFLALALAAYTAHAMLNARRPPARNLTLFYLVVATGGAAGGLLNGFIAPTLFNGVWEYPLVVASVVLLNLKTAADPTPWLTRRYHPHFVRFLEASVMTSLLIGLSLGTADLVRTSGWVAVGVLLGIGLLALLLVRRPGPVALGALSVILVFSVAGSTLILRDRSFYGAYTVRQVGEVRLFAHGTTVHGQQADGARRYEPSTYYAHTGPVGQAFAAVPDASNVAVVGLGVGTIAAYGQPNQRITFFEIDADVADVASDPALFTYLKDSKADIEVAVVDGRLGVESEPDSSYDILILDAFASDSIPVHLLTREAMSSYSDVLQEGGLLMVHISNRLFDLEPVLAGGAASIGWSAIVGEGTANVETGATASVWVAMSEDPELLARLATSGRWRPIGTDIVTWTDDYSSVLSVLR